MVRGYSRMKKIIALVLCMAVLMAVVFSGTIAYFTDTDKDLNVFTVGKVVIELIEKQRNGSGGYKDFVNDKKLMPMFAPSEFDDDGLPTAKEFQDKIVTVKNIGESDAYVRVFVGVPAELDTRGAIHLVDGSRFNNKKSLTGYSLTGRITGRPSTGWSITSTAIRSTTLCL